MESAPPADRTADAFLAVLPRLAAVARFHFRSVRCPAARADGVAEALALCWDWFRRLASQGRQPHTFASALARFAALAVKAGRRLTGAEPATEVLAPPIRTRRRVTVQSLTRTTPGEDPVDPLADAVADNTATPVPAQVQFRLDFPAWRNRLPQPRRAVVDLLAAGNRTDEVARAVGLSAGRVSQLRRELAASYRRYCLSGQLD